MNGSSLKLQEKLQETARQLGLPSAALEQYLALKAAEVGAHRPASQTAEAAPQDAAELVRAHALRAWLET